ncbi:MAG: HNH endonuclease, partial [Bacteroidales bacterium]
DIITVSNDQIENFKFYGESYNNDGMKSVYDSQGWNDYQKSSLLGFESLGEMNALLDQFNSQWSRQNAIDFLQDPSVSNAMAMSGSEALSQWTNPELVVGGLSAGVGGVAGMSRTARTSTAGLRNGHLAGKLHPKTGVPFTEKGFPNFTNYLYKGGKADVTIKPTGTRVGDFAAANSIAGYSSTPKGYTWHHHQTMGRMQLVRTTVHLQTGHTGGFSLWYP